MRLLTHSGLLWICLRRQWFVRSITLLWISLRTLVLNGWYRNGILALLRFSIVDIMIWPARISLVLVIKMLPNWTWLIGLICFSRNRKLSLLLKRCLGSSGLQKPRLPMTFWTSLKSSTLGWQRTHQKKMVTMKKWLTVLVTVSRVKVKKAKLVRAMVLLVTMVMKLVRAMPLLMVKVKKKMEKMLLLTVLLTMATMTLMAMPKMKKLKVPK